MTRPSPTASSSSLGPSGSKHPLSSSAGPLGLLRTSALLLCAAACGREPVQPPDLLLISVDTMRADFLSTYGHPRPTSDALDRLAEQGAVFLNHHSTSSQTAPSHASLLTGLHLREHGLLKNGLPLSTEPAFLPQILEQAGWTTAASMALGFFDASEGFQRGFQSFVAAGPDNLGTRGSTEYVRIAADVVDSALEQLATVSPDEPFAQLVHLFDPHTPYAYPPRLGELDEQAGAAVLTDRMEPWERFGPDELLELHLLYEAEVDYTFHELDRLVGAWDAARGVSNTVIAVTADHGEGLGEHDYLSHDLFLYEEQLHIPLVIRAPFAIPPGTRIEAPSSAIDVGATLLDLLGLRPGSGGLPGVSLAPLWRGEPRRTRPIVAQRPLHDDDDLDGNAERRSTLEWHAGRPAAARGELLSLTDWPYKLIWSADGEPALYDLLEDPAERRDLSAERPEVAARLGGELDEWFAKRRPAPEGLELTVPPSVREQLEALGYGGGGPGPGPVEDEVDGPDVEAPPTAD